MATRPTTRAKRRSSAAEAAHGNAVYLLALETMQRLASERDRYENRGRALEAELERKQRELRYTETQLTASRAAAEVAEAERIKFEQDRDKYAARCGATLDSEGYEVKQRVNGFQETT